MGTAITFYALATIGLISALMVVTRRNIMHCALFLVLALLSVAGSFLLMEADFLALVQVLLYAGGIMVLILFAIFLTQHIAGTTQPQTNEQKVGALIACAVLGGVMLLAIKGTSFPRAVPADFPQGTAPSLGELLLSSYVLPFEVASLVLLAAIVGVVMIAGRSHPNTPQDAGRSLRGTGEPAPLSTGRETRR